MKTALATVLRWPLPARWLGLGALLLAVGCGWCGVRAARIWQAATPPGRTAILILLVILVLTLAGCAQVPRLSAEILRQDEATCAANPRPLPACIFGLVIFGKWTF